MFRNGSSCSRRGQLPFDLLAQGFPSLPEAGAGLERRQRLFRLTSLENLTVGVELDDVFRREAGQLRLR
eukprot:5610021-Pyramimonas_sp.AAC.1